MRYRPITSSLRAAFFNYLGDNIEECIIMDGFAGTGIVGFEALSRGASSVVFVENNRAAASLIEKNSKQLNALQNCTVVCMPVEKALVKQRIAKKIDIIFLDPPFNYPIENISGLFSLIMTNDLLSEQGIIAVRYQKYKGKLELHTTTFSIIKEFKESEAFLEIYQRIDSQT